MAKAKAAPTEKLPRHRLSLYELGEEVMALEDLVAMDEGEWTDEHEALEKEILDKMVRKADSYGGYIKNLEATAEACKGEAARLTARRTACEARVARLKQYASQALIAMGKEQIKGDLFTLANQENNPTVELSVGVDKLEALYVRVTPEVREPDKRAILAALQSGVEIEGCKVVRTVSLRIR